MRLAERIAAKRADRAKGHVEVDQWGEDGKPLRLYFSQVSARDIEKVTRKHPNFMANPSLGAMVDLILAKAEDDQGEKLFTLEDKPILMGEDVSVLAKVFGAIFNADSIEDHEKN